MVTQVKDSIGVTAAGARYATLSQILEGEVRSDRVARGIYATDASEYQQQPEAVAFPKTDADVPELIRFAGIERVGRAAVPTADRSGWPDHFDASRRDPFLHDHS